MRTPNNNTSGPGTFYSQAEREQQQTQYASNNNQTQSTLKIIHPQSHDLTELKLMKKDLVTQIGTMMNLNISSQQLSQ